MKLEQIKNMIYPTHNPSEDKDEARSREMPQKAARRRADLDMTI
jgi:hypothetical protein